MQHFLVILLGMHLGVGLLLLQVGPLSALMREARGDALLSRLILALFILMLWPCLWPSAVYRPQFRMSSLTFELDSRLDPFDQLSQFDRDNVAPSSDALAG
jgi:hypothetical protein